MGEKKASSSGLSTGLELGGRGYCSDSPTDLGVVAATLFPLPAIASFYSLGCVVSGAETLSHYVCVRALTSTMGS